MQEKVISEQLNQVESLLTDAAYIGIYNTTQVVLLKKIARSNGLESALHVKAIVEGEKNYLTEQFDELARSDGFGSLKDHPQLAVQMWRAKFRKDPPANLFNQ